MIAWGPDGGQDCAHGRYAPACPECSGVVVDGSSGRFALVFVVVAIVAAVCAPPAAKLDGQGFAAAVAVALDAPAKLAARMAAQW